MRLPGMSILYKVWCIVGKQKTPEPLYTLYSLPHTKRGFTLIELLIAISIVAVIASIGFVSYSQAQASARDLRRKNDLQAIATALELYYQTNKRYPCPGDGVWNWSSAGEKWIQDDGCGGTGVTFDNSYINRTPVDPVNNSPVSGNPPLATGFYGYGYRGYYSSLCGNKQGQFYILYTQLENKKDPQSIQGDKNKPKDCDGSPIDWPDGTFSITSE